MDFCCGVVCLRQSDDDKIVWVFLIWKNWHFPFFGVFVVCSCLVCLFPLSFCLLFSLRFWSPKGLIFFFSACGAVLGPSRPAPQAPAYAGGRGSRRPCGAKFFFWLDLRFHKFYREIWKVLGKKGTQTTQLVESKRFPPIPNSNVDFLRKLCHGNFCVQCRFFSWHYFEERQAFLLLLAWIKIYRWAESTELAEPHFLVNFQRKLWTLHRVGGLRESV